MKSESYSRRQLTRGRQSSISIATCPQNVDMGYLFFCAEWIKQFIVSLKMLDLRKFSIIIL